MRTFILSSRTAKTSPDFNMEDLPGSGGKMDTVARFVTSSLWISHNLRRDTEAIIILNGPPNPPVAVKFEGETLKRVSPDERSIAGWIRKTLSKKLTSSWQETSLGIRAAKISLQSVIRELSNRPIYVLHERGRDISEIQIQPDPVFVTGDQLGLLRADEKFALRYGQKISLGKQKYFASACASVLNWMCDNSDL